MTLIVGVGNKPSDTTVTFTLEELKVLTDILNRDKLYTYAELDHPGITAMADKFTDYLCYATSNRELYEED